MPNLLSASFGQTTGVFFVLLVIGGGLGKLGQSLLNNDHKLAAFIVWGFCLLFIGGAFYSVIHGV